MKVTVIYLFLIVKNFTVNPMHIEFVKSGYGIS